MSYTFSHFLYACFSLLFLWDARWSEWVGIFLPRFCFLSFSNFIFTCDVLLLIWRNNSLTHYDNGTVLYDYFSVDSFINLISLSLFIESRFHVNEYEHTSRELLFIFFSLHRNSDVSQNTPERGTRKWHLEKQINLRFHLVMNAKRSVRHFLINPIYVWGEREKHTKQRFGGWGGKSGKLKKKIQKIAILAFHENFH